MSKKNRTVGLNKKTLKRLAKLNIDGTALVIETVARPPKPARRILKSLGLKFW